MMNAELSRRPRSPRFLVGIARVLGVTALALATAIPPVQGEELAKRLLRYSGVIDGPTDRALQWPVAVAAGTSDEVAAVDARNNRVVIFHRVGAGWPARREVALPATPVAIAFVGGRYLVAVRGGAGLLAIAGGESAEEPAEIALPERILPLRLAASSDGALLVWDGRGGRIVKLRDGAVVAQVPLDGTVTALSSDGAGGAWAAIGARGEVVRFDGGGNRVATWRLPSDGPVPPWPSGIAVEPGGKVFVLDRHLHRVVVLDGSGKPLGLGSGKGWEPGQLLYPDGLVRLPGGALLVCDGGNGRVQLFEVVGAGAG